MNEIFFWCGIVLAVSFFIISIVLFLKLDIPQVISFYLRIGSYKLDMIPIGNNPIAYSGNEITSEQDTLILDMDKTELLNSAQNYATVLLDAENLTLSSSNKIAD